MPTNGRQRMTASLKARVRPPPRGEASSKIKKNLKNVSPPETEPPTAKQISDLTYFLAFIAFFIAFLAGCASSAWAAAFFMPFFMALERGDGGQINKLSREWSPALECWTTISFLPNQRAENESTSTGPQARPLKRAPQQIWVFIFVARDPRAPGAPGGTPGPSVGVSATSGALPEAPGTHHDPNQKKR